MRLIALVLLCACVDGTSKTRPDCAKVLCAEDEYCRYTSGGAELPDSADDLPECTTAPSECDGEPTCACLTECTSCEEDDGLIRCYIETP